MSTARLAGSGGVTTMIALHATGHEWAKDGTLLRVDCDRGIGWVATHYDPSLRVIQRVRGSDEEVHRAAARMGTALGRAVSLHVVDMHRGRPENPVGPRAGYSTCAGRKPERGVNVEFQSAG